MTKRLADTEIWEKNWFLDLNDKQKLLIKFLFDKCDCAGFYPICWKIIKMSFSSEITKADFEGLKQVRFVNEDTVFIEDFIYFQYGIKNHKDLNPNNNVHKGIINRLKKYNCYQVEKVIVVNVNEPINQVEIIQPKKTDPFFDPLIDEAFKTYEDNCPNLPKLRFERRNRDIRELTAKLLTEIDQDMATFKEICQKANELKKIAEKTIDFKSMCNNYIGILNGKYKDQATNFREDLKAAYEKFSARKEEENKNK